MRSALTLAIKNSPVIWKIYTMRVAVCQFATTSNPQENLASCIRMITKAALCQPSLIVLPQYCNTHFAQSPLSHTFFGDEQTHSEQAYYVDHNQAWYDALTLDGSFLKEVAEQAIKHRCYIVVNVTLRRDNVADLVDTKVNSIESKTTASIKSQGDISVTSCLFCPQGKLIHQADKHCLSAQEKQFFTATKNTAQVITTPLGTLGLLSGSDSMNFLAPRALALSGAQLLCNSINSDTLDQSNLHDPARAVENNVFVATANKIGSGQSQIVSNDGRVLAKLNSTEEGVAFTDIDLASSCATAKTDTKKSTEKSADSNIGFNNKFRPDGTHIIKQRRPELYLEADSAPSPNIYQTLTIRHTEQVEAAQPRNSTVHKVPVTANVAIFATYKANEHAIEDVCQYIENNVTDIIQLPELFFVADKTVTNDEHQRERITALSRQFIAQVSAVLRPFQYLCTSLIIDGKHQAVLISKQGVVATQQQLHFCQRYQWTDLGDKLAIIALPLEQGTIRLAMLTADDANIAEIVNVAALATIQVLLVPFDIQEPSEVDYSLLTRAAENRLCIVAASREKNFANEVITDIDSNNIYGKNKVKVQKSTGVIINLTTDPSLLPQWRVPKFNGYINQPLLKLQYGKITKAVIHPIAACTKYQLF